MALPKSCAQWLGRSEVGIGKLSTWWKKAPFAQGPEGKGRGREDLQDWRYHGLNVFKLHLDSGIYFKYVPRRHTLSNVS